MVGDEKMKWELVILAGMGVGFGCYALYLGHNTVVIAGVFTLIGTIAGYVYGKKTSEETS